MENKMNQFMDWIMKKSDIFPFCREEDMPEVPMPEMGERQHYCTECGNSVIGDEDTKGCSSCERNFELAKEE
ncbi:MAG: hypothetical protein NUV80_00870 [Candidatus Berkelbacteria bacterium]|nr:hypothetical protein [Candidatus Berkelbacteria bacterium]